MRLWHYQILDCLPKSQLIAQWRELNSIYKKQDNHILINYIYDYPKSTLKNYSDLVIAEMQKRGYKINKWDNYNEYFKGVEKDNSMFDEHDNYYKIICFWNLYEKFIRGQKDFEIDDFCNLSNVYKEIRNDNQSII